MSFERVSKRIETYRNAMIDFQIALASIPAISPASGGLGEARKAEAILPFLRENEFVDIEVLKAPDLDAREGYRPNIIAYYRGRSSARTIWIMTHTDVVPPGETSLWDGNPFRPWVKGGKIFGRGVEDNQQDLVASLFAVKAFRDEGLAPSCDIGLALVADEETGSEKGIGYVLKNSKAFRPQDIIVVPDAGNQDGTMIEIAEKSLLWLKFTTLGKQTHGSTPERGINAHRAAAFLIAELHRLYEIFPQNDPVFDPPISTFEPTKKEANVPNINTIPGEDVFYMDNRILPTVPVDDVLARIGELSAGIEAKFGVKVTLEYKQRADAAPPTRPDAPVVTALQKAIGDVLQRSGKPMGIGGGTVAALFRRAGFPAACWSTMDETAHQPNEYCIINNMVGDAKVFAHLMLQE
jgi:succinyl-diaminopimelate desuccinylase